MKLLPTSMFRPRLSGLAVVFAAAGALGFRGEFHPRQAYCLTPSSVSSPCCIDDPSRFSHRLRASKESLDPHSHLMAVRQSSSSTPSTYTRDEFVRSFAKAVVLGGITGIVVSATRAPVAGAADTEALESARSALIRARDQLNAAPDLLRDEKWDLVRALLLKPPLQELWSNKGSSVAASYVDEVGQKGGDELEALELRESLSSHLRYLDMAVYNNVFNPITSQGKTGASAELIRSYYEDPTNEYRASLSALQDLISLSDRLV